MKIRILTQYYPPETGAPQNRLHSLALNLQSMGQEVDVLTAMPSYPKSQVFLGYRGKLAIKEKIDGILVRRSWIYVPRSKHVVPRLINYFSFVVSSFLRGIFQKRSDFILCESPPLFLGIAAYLLCIIKGSKLIFNVSDLWPESAEKLGIVTNVMFLNMAYKLESFIYRRSILVTGQTMGIVNDVKKRFPLIECQWLPNGIDKDVYNVKDVTDDWKIALGLKDKRVFIYAGIVGHAQALDVILKARALLMESKAYLIAQTAFVIVGDGPDKHRLLQLQNELGTDVVFIPNTPKDQALKMVASCFAYIVPLRKLDLFLGAIPSKIFDPLAFGIPIILAVDGEARELFIEQAKAGIFVEPENPKELSEAVYTLVENSEDARSLGESGKDFIETNFDRAQIASEFLESLQQFYNQK